MKIEIKHRFSGVVLFSHDVENNTIKLTLEAAVKAEAYLAKAYLTGADLAGAYLAGADLAGAYLAGADLAGAYLAKAYLTGANLAKAYLAGADLTRADLTGADLTGANLSGANLSGADLAGAYLDGETITSTPLSLLNLTWPVLITNGYMRIGCKRHTHSEWAGFSDAEISNMDLRATEFWNKWRDVLLAMCKQHSGDTK